jgi:hypothetical protein
MGVSDHVAELELLRRPRARQALGLLGRASAVCRGALGLVGRGDADLEAPGLALDMRAGKRNRVHPRLRNARNLAEARPEDHDLARRARRRGERPDAAGSHCGGGQTGPRRRCR